MVATKQEVIDFNDYKEVKEGFPIVTAGRYLARVVAATVRVAKSGHAYVNYSPMLLASTQDDETADGDGLPIRGMRLGFDSIFLTPNALDRDGNLRGEKELEQMTKRMRGQAKSVVRKMTGQELAFQGTEAEVAQQIRDAIDGVTFVLSVGVKGTDDEAENVIRAHYSETTWEGEQA